MFSGSGNPHYTGEPTPKHLKHGPNNDRRCTDLFCLTTFFIFWAGTIGIAYYSFNNGDPMKLTYVFDQWNNPCGVGDQADYPYLFFIKNTDTSDDSDYFFANQTVCISQCPGIEAKSFECAPDFTDAEYECSDLYSSENFYPTIPFVDRFCIPTTDYLVQNLYNINALDFGFFFKIMADLKVAWWMMIVAGVIALIFGFGYLILMKYFSGALLWGLLVGCIALLTVFGFLCLEDAQGGGDLSDISPSTLTSIDPFLLYLIAVGCFLVALIGVIFICYFRGRINLSIAVLKAAVHFIEEEKTTLFVPPLLFILSLVFYILWVFIAVFIIGTNDLQPDTETHYPVGSIIWSAPHVGMIIYHIVGLFWNHALGVSVSQFILASAACLWYFTQGDKNARKPVVWTSSLALGGFLIGLLDIFTSIIGFFNKHFGNSSKEGEQKGFCLACCACCFSCFDRFMKFINRHAYIQIAMTGEGFCRATEDAYYLLTRNIVRFGLVHSLAWLFLVVGELFITFISTLLCYVIISRADYFTTRLYSPIAPTIFFFLVSWIVSSIFMGVYGVSADAIIHCFAMDEEIHEGTAQHAPKELKEFINGSLQKKLLSED